MSTSLDTSVDTSEILEIAEKLVDDAEKKIVQVNYDIKNFHLEDHSCTDESVMYVRDIVNTKFKELNRDLLSPDNNFYESQHCNCDRRNDGIKFPRVYTLQDNKQIINKEIRIKPQSKEKRGILQEVESIKIHSNQSLVSSLKDNVVRRNNFIIGNLRNDSSEAKEKKDSVDTAVQTSIQETLKKSEVTEENISEGRNELNPETSSESNRQNLNKIIDVNKSKGSFIEFICKISELETNDNNISDINFEEIEDQNDLSCNKTSEVEIINDNFDLYSPKLENVDRILSNFDRKMKTFAKNSNKLADIFARLTFYNNNNSINIKKSDKENNLEVKLQSSNLSSELTISSESLQPPKRFSTPLNNYSINIDVKNSCNNIEDSIPFVNLDINNESKVIITRNKFSSSATSEKNLQDSKISSKSEIEISSSETFQKTQKQVEFNDFCEDIVKESDYQQEAAKILDNSFNINTQKVSDSNRTELECKKSISEEKTLSKSVKLPESSINNKAKDTERVELDNLEINLVADSSKDDLRDRTSFDVSAIYSESFETASLSENEIARDEIKKVNDKVDNLELNKEEDAKVEMFPSIGLEKNNIYVSNVEEAKDESQASEIIKSISVEENNSINQSDDLNSSVKSSTKISGNKLLSLESSQQLCEKGLLVGISEEKNGKSSYSEGELHQLISLGEVRPTGTFNSQEDNSNYYQNLTDHMHNILNSSLQSLGEILNSNAESTSNAVSQISYSYY